MTLPLRALALAFSFVSLAAAKAPPGPAIYDPDPTQKDAGTLQGETWSRESPTASLWLTRIDEATRNEFLKKRSGLPADIFKSTPGREGSGFIAFHVLVENRTESRVIFQPQSCRLEVGDQDEFQEPLDLPTIISLFSMLGRPVPDGIEKLRSAIIDGEIILKPGERRDGLFIFHALDPATKKFRIDVAATLGQGDPFGFTAYYKRRKK